ncbi:hypothetical protein ABPG72_020347 [Tetrahymena utriculariae]
MVCHKSDNRLESITLLQRLNQFEIDEESLKSLQFTSKNTQKMNQSSQKELPININTELCQQLVTKPIESQENEICDNEENLLDFLDEQNEKQITQQKKQIEILVSSLEQQVQKLEHNFSEAYFAQDNSYKGTLLGINVQNKKITLFYSWDSCFEQIDQIQHNKDDLNDINQFYKNGQKKSILEKYQFIITKSQFNLLIQCLKCQLKNEVNASNYDLDSYQKQQLSKADEMLLNDIFSEKTQNTIQLENSVNNIIPKQFQQQAEQIVEQQNSNSQNQFSVQINQTISNQVTNNEKQILDQPSLDVQQQQIKQQKIVSVLIDNQAEKQQEFEKNESINQLLQIKNQINSENNKNLNEQSNTLQTNNQLIQDIHNKNSTTESIQNQTFQKPFLNFQKINNNNLSTIQKTEIEQKSQQENNQCLKDQQDQYQLMNFFLAQQNCTLDDKQLAQINNSLKKCSQLESLNLNLQKKRISDQQINRFFEDFYNYKSIMPTCNIVNNDQIYSHLKFLLDAFELKYDQISINNQSNQIVVYENILEEDTICNLINLKKLELNLSSNKIDAKGANAIAKGINSCNLLTNLELHLRDDKNQIVDQFYNSISKILVSLVKLKQLELGLDEYETLLKSSEIINCRNIRDLKLLVKHSDSQQKIIIVKILASKIKRLVKLNIGYYY